MVAMVGPSKWVMSALRSSNEGDLDGIYGLWFSFMNLLEFSTTSEGEAAPNNSGSSSTTESHPLSSGGSPYRYCGDGDRETVSFSVLGSDPASSYSLGGALPKQPKRPDLELLYFRSFGEEML